MFFATDFRALPEVCREMVFVSQQLRTKNRKKFGMRRNPSYLCIVNQTKNNLSDKEK